MEYFHNEFFFQLVDFGGFHKTRYGNIQEQVFLVCFFVQRNSELFMEYFHNEFPPKIRVNIEKREDYFSK